MNADWVAGSVRARALVRRCVGAGRARRLAASPSLAVALAALAETPYGREPVTGLSLAGAQRAVAATCLWHLRVLAGWLPRDGVKVVRAAAGWFEIANVDGLLQHLSGLSGPYGLSGPSGLSGIPADEPFELGTLAAAWPRLRGVSAPAGLRAELAASPWGDPGGEDPRTIRLSMRLAAAARLTAAAPASAPWAAGAAAVLVAGERFGTPHGLPETVAPLVGPLLGPRAMTAGSLREMAEALPRNAAWALDGVDDPAALWGAEARCWARTERDGFALLRTSGFSVAPVLGAIAVLVADCRRVRSALEVAARGGGPLEAYDAVA